MSSFSSKIVIAISIACSNPVLLTPLIMIYVLDIEDWWAFYDLNIPDSGWYSIGQDENLNTYIKITDPTWSAALAVHTPFFLIPQWIH